MVRNALKNAPPLDETRLYVFLAESLFNGIFWVHFWSCNVSLYKRSAVRRERLLSPMLCVGWLIFLSITVHWIACTCAMFLAFVVPVDESYCKEAGAPSRASAWFSHTSEAWLIVEPTSYACAAILADGFLIYRLFIVWSGNWLIIVIPCITVAGIVVVTSMTAKLFATSGEFIFGSSKGWTTAAFALTTACNAYSTTFIAYKIHKTQKNTQVGQAYKSTFQRVSEVLVQSAAIHCLLSCISLIFMTLDSNAAFISVAMAVPTIGIIFCMIVNRTHGHVSQEYDRLHNNLRPRSDSGAGTGTGEGTRTAPEGETSSTPQRSILGASTIRTSTSREGTIKLGGGTSSGNPDSPPESPMANKPVEYANQEKIV